MPFLPPVPMKNAAYQMAGGATAPGSMGGMPPAPSFGAGGSSGGAFPRFDPNVAQYKADPTSAYGTPYGQYVAGGRPGTGTLPMFRAGAAQADYTQQRNQGMRDARASGRFFGPNAGGSAPIGPMSAPAGSSPTGVMPTNSGIVPPTGAGMAGASTGASDGSTPAGWLGSNPLLTQQLANMGQQMGQQFSRQILPQINSNAIMAGGYGGSKQGIAQGIAAGDAMNGYINAGTNLLANDWTNQQNRDLTSTGMAQNFYSDQRAQDRADLTTGAALYGQGTSGQWSPIQNANGVYGTYTGFGPSTSSSNAGGGWLGAIGGAGTALQMANGWNWG